MLPRVLFTTSLLSLCAFAVIACSDDESSSWTPPKTDAGVGGSAGSLPDGGGEDAAQGGSAGSAGQGGAAGEAGQAGSGGQGGEPLPTGAIVIGMWCGLPASELTQARVDEIAEANFTTMTNACDGATFNATYNQKMLELADKAKLGVFVTDLRGLEAAAGTNVDANLDGLVADYAKHPAMLAYHITDEPNASLFPKLAAVNSGLATRDPAHFASINLFPDYAAASQLGTATYDEYVAQFLSVVKPAAYTYDHYNFLSDGSDGPTFFANLAVVRAHSVATGIPFGQYIQSISYNGHRDTDGPEKRWAALHTLAYGGRGVMYFTYWTPPQTAENFGLALIDPSGNRTAQYEDVKSINVSLKAMGKYLGAATSTKVFHNGPLDLGTAPRAPGDLVYVPSAAPLTVGLFSVNQDAYALIVNRNHDAVTESDVIVASGNGKVDMLDIATGQWVAAPNASADPLGIRIHGALAAGDGVLLHLPGPLPPGPPGAEGYFGTVRADAGWLDVVDSSFGTGRLRTAGWHQCPEGTVEVGQDFQSNGFWFCARSDLNTRTFYVGNVVADAGAMYKVVNGTTTPLGPGGWDTCPGGTLLGHRIAADGFWVCME